MVDMMQTRMLRMLDATGHEINIECLGIRHVLNQVFLGSLQRHLKLAMSHPACLMGSIGLPAGMFQSQPID